MFANSMQTRQRKIPFTDGSLYGHWRDCLPEYEKEYAAFEKHVEEIGRGILPQPPSPGDADKLPEAPFELLSGGETFAFAPGQQLFTDKDSPIELCASELNGLTGVRMGMGEAIVTGVRLKIRLSRRSRILIGYIDDRGVEWLAPPSLETDTHAEDRGGYAPVLIHGAKAKGLKALNIHAFLYDAGDVELDFGTGAFVVAGVIPDTVPLTPRDAGLDAESLTTLDWLYEEDM